MSLDKHFRSVGQAASAPTDATLDPMLIWVTLAIMAVGIAGAGWFVFTTIRERRIARMLLAELEAGPDQSADFLRRPAD